MSEGSFKKFLFILNGTEELFEYRGVIDVRKEIKELWYDTLCMTKPYRRESIGSAGDGILRFNIGFTDEAILLENTAVLQDEETNVPRIVNFLADQRFSSPGFCRLRILPGLKFQNDVYIEENGDIFLSSEKFIKMCLQLSRRNSSIERPFIRTGGLQLAYVIPFNSWPVCAEAWLHRERPRCWPSEDLISEMKHTTCFCEPIANGLSQHPGLEWRISFAVAEKRLMGSLDSTIFKMYQILKILAREKIDLQSGSNNIISPYVIRTTLYWVCENGLPNIVSGRNFESCLLIFINQLEKWIKKEFCPHFFVPERNILKNGISPLSKACLLQCFGDIKVSLFSSILNLPSFESMKVVYKAGNSTSIPTSENIKLHQELGIFTYSSGMSYCVLHSGYAFEILENIETMFVNSTELSETQRSFLKVLFHPLAKATGIILFHNAALKLSRNKSSYGGVRLSTRLSLLGTKSDAISGRLSLATLYYICGQYRSCIQLTDSILQDIKPFTIYNNSKYGIIQDDACVNLYSDVMLHAPIPLEKKMQMAYMSDFEVFKERPVIPSYLHLEAEFFQSPPVVSSLPSLVYLHFLRFLSFLELNRESERRSALVDLQTISYDEVHGGNTYISSNMIGICEMISGNIPMAIKYFGQAAIALRRDNIPCHENVGLIRIALLLNSRVNM